MGIINKIRARAGLAVGLIAVGLALFLVGGDVLSPNSVLLRRNREQIGKIAGERISVTRFQEVLDRLSQNYRINNGQSPDNEALYALREQAWQQLILEIAYQEEFDALGLQVSDAELVDMVQGEHVRPEVVRAFTDPETQDFDPATLREYLANLANLPPEQQALWYQFESELRPLRVNEKYNNLFTKTQYLTQRELSVHHRLQQERRSLRYLFVPYHSVSDTLISVSDKDLKAYLRAHARAYVRDKETRGVSFVRFDLTPTASDSLAVRNGLAALRTSFAQSSDDSLFSQAHSDADTYYRSYAPADLPAVLAEAPTTPRVGDVLGPVATDEGFALYKVSAIGGGTGAQARARHILIKKPEDGSASAEKREEAENILWQLQNGVAFNLMAQLRSEDASADKGGDLGWFGRGQMVPPFEEAVFSAKQTGLIPRVVETVFGYHVIQVDALPNKDNYTVAEVAHHVYPSENTYALTYEAARSFSETTYDKASFRAEADSGNRFVEDLKDIEANQRQVGTLSDARPLVRWLFHESDEEDVSEVFEMEQAFVVALHTGTSPAGVPDLADVRDEIAQEVTREKKSLRIKERLDVSKQSTLEDWAGAYGTEAAIYQASDVSWNLPSLTEAGDAPKAVGVAFALPLNEWSDAVEAQNGVLILEVIAITPPVSEDQSLAAQQMEAQRNGLIYGQLMPTVQELKNVEDNRHKFY